MSMISSVGFDGLSRKNAFVSGRTAWRHSLRCVPSTRVQGTPNCGSRSSTTQRQDPNRACAATTWSPARTCPIMRRRHGRHPRRGGASRFGPFEAGHALLEHRHGRVREAGVGIARLLVEKARLGGLGGVVDEALSQVERLGGFAERRALRTLVDEARFEVVFARAEHGTASTSVLQMEQSSFLSNDPEENDPAAPGGPRHFPPAGSGFPRLPLGRRSLKLRGIPIPFPWTRRMPSLGATSAWLLFRWRA